MEFDTYIFMSASEEEGSDTSEWLPFPDSIRKISNKEVMQSSSEEALTMDRKRKPTDRSVDDKEDMVSMEEYSNNPDIEPPPVSKSANRLPSEMELAPGMREMSSGNMISLIINRAKASKKIAAKSQNLKGTFKSYIREGAGMQKTAATEMSKRVNAT